jgi:hypothetical protein
MAVRWPFCSWANTVILVHVGKLTVTLEESWSRLEATLCNQAISSSSALMIQDLFKQYHLHQHWWFKTFPNDIIFISIDDSRPFQAISSSPALMIQDLSSLHLLLMTSPQMFMFRLNDNWNIDLRITGSI